MGSSNDILDVLMQDTELADLLFVASEPAEPVQAAEVPVTETNITENVSKPASDNLPLLDFIF